MRLRLAEEELRRALRHTDGSIEAGQRLFQAWRVLEVARCLAQAATTKSAGEFPE